MPRIGHIYVAAAKKPRIGHIRELKRAAGNGGEGQAQG